MAKAKTLNAQQKGLSKTPKETWNILMDYAGRWSWLIWVSIIAAVFSTLTGIIPYIYIHKIINNILQENPNIDHIIRLAWLVVLFFVISILLYFISLSLSHILAFRIESGIRSSSMKRFMDMPLGFFKEQASGKLRKTIDDNAGLTHNMIAHNTPDLAAVAVFPLIMLIVFFLYDWRMGLTSLLTIFAAVFLIFPMYSGKNQDCVHNYMTAQEQMNASAVEYVRGIPVVKVFQQTIHSFRAFREAIKNYSTFSLEYTYMARKWMLMANIMVRAAVYFLIPLAIVMINRNSNPIEIICNLVFYVLFSGYSANQIIKILSIGQGTMHATEVVNRIEGLFIYEPMTYGKHEETEEHTVSYKNVSFHYPNTKRDVVSKVSFDIPQGKFIALVGESGGGKSTLASLLPRFYDPQEGSISIGEIPVQNFSRKALMNQISFVFQNQSLFKETVLENIRKPKPHASEEEVLEACRKAQCLDVVEKLPEGLHSVVGGKGVFLSGGEEQRLLLARAFLKNAPILVLDEATAFTDPENERLIQAAFRRLMANKTTLMIAHRLSSVIDADCIMVMESGKIVEKGNHEALLEQGGIYAAMWKDFNTSATWRI
ncbi:MAG: ABC transporter ATP-binding protein [Christensenellaceae bacterium]|nr:ABC transporter ATP-binding protein [Christensenellaceae bacterium]